MKKNYIQNIIVHIADNADFHFLAERMSQFHADVIERRLHQSSLTMEQKTKIIDEIIGNLRLREVDGIIK